MSIQLEVGHVPLDGAAIDCLQSLGQQAMSLYLGKHQVCIVLTDDERLHELNRLYRDQHRPTDVLSFDLGMSVEPFVDERLGEIYISWNRASEQAENQDVSLVSELGRLIVHGVLHLAGYEHDTSDKLLMMEGMTDTLLKSAGLQN